MPPTISHSPTKSTIMYNHVSVHPSTLNVSALNHISLMAKANTTECLRNLPPTGAGVASDIEVKVGISPLGGATVVPLHFSNLRLW